MTPSPFDKLLSSQAILALAPMDGYTDQPFRRVCKRFGAQLLYSEFVNGVDVIYHSRFERTKIRFTEYEHPFGIQLYDHDMDRLIKAARIVEEYGPDFIDINLGCSIRAIKNRGAGAGLLREPEKISYLFENLSRQLSVPITAKIRLGWDSQALNYLEVAKILASSNVKLLAVHGRTADQTYQEPINFQALQEFASQTTLPLLINGDIGKLYAINEILAAISCNGVMIGRAAIGNPWVFDRDLPPETLIPRRERLSVIEEHLNSQCEFYGEELGIKQFRKHLARYLAPIHLSGAKKASLFTLTIKEDVESCLNELLAG